MTPFHLLRAAGAVAGLALLPACSPATPAPVVPKAQAPVTPKRTEPALIPNVRFTDITHQSGIQFVHENAMAGEKLLPETMGSGCAFFDYDGDGDQDLLLVNGIPWPDQTEPGARLPVQALYQNDGHGQFTDVTESSGLAVSLFGMGVAVGDYDNDGDPDLYLTTLDGGRLFRNDSGRFVDVTEAANAGGGGGWLTSAAFFDLENDGDLDLFLCRYVSWSAEFDRAQSFPLAGVGRGYGPPTAFEGSFCTLLRNDGGTFTDVSEESGIRVRTLDLKQPMAKSLGIAPWDIDGDGLVDLAIANDTVPNFLFHNLGDGKFEEIATTSGVAFDLAGAARGAMGIDWAHFVNDDSLALAIGNFANEMTALYVSEDPTRMLFSDQAHLFGLGAPTQNPLKFGLFFFDYDLDGRPDLLSVNGHLENDIEKTQQSMTYRQPAQLFWNSGRRGPTLFTLVPADKCGPDLLQPIVGRGSAYADIDGDGDLDVCLTDNGGPARLLRNDGGTGHHWLRLRLIGRQSNRDAIGARVTLRAGGVTQRRQLFPAKSYLSSVEFPLTFGLGTADRVDSLEIRWPSGATTHLEQLDVDRTLTVDEAAGVISPPTPRSVESVHALAPTASAVE
ncbi:MAG: RNA-binding protein [Isosphaeraceae bacterium]|jgi:hypothetical protein|nr:MAG: RNA-binding protein [Isosphaeraceae bacterium]